MHGKGEREHPKKKKKKAAVRSKGPIVSYQEAEARADPLVSELLAVVADDGEEEERDADRVHGHEVDRHVTQRQPLVGVALDAVVGLWW